ncbi:MAG TPA: hypothetical protein VFU21_30735 [Kofleriaceae bacterium]|nr:hypothetical protein [Kofleriaceae bacterium]
MRSRFFFIAVLLAPGASACTTTGGGPGTDEALASDPARIGQNIWVHPDDPASYVSNPDGRVAVARLGEHCASEARMVVHPKHDGSSAPGFYADQARVLLAAGIEPYLILNAETLGLGNTDLSTDWPRVRADIASRAGDLARALAAAGTRATIEVWNEPDDPPEAVAPGDPSITHVPAGEFGGMVAEVASAVKSSCPACRVVSGGLEGAPGQPDTGRVMAAYMRAAFPAGMPAGVDAIGVHYVLTPADLAWAAGARIAVTESWDGVTAATLGLTDATIILGQDFTPDFTRPGPCAGGMQPGPALACELTLERWTGAASVYTTASTSLAAGTWVRWWVESNPGVPAARWNTGSPIAYWNGGNYNCEPELYNPTVFPACGHSDWFQIPAGVYDRSATFAGAGASCTTPAIRIDVR